MIGAAEFIVAVLGIELLPGGGWLWAALAGVASGTAFPLVMTLPLDVARRSAGVGAVTAVMLGGGYAISATCPFVLGAVRDATGSFSEAMWVLAGTSVGLLALVASLSAERLRTHPEPSTIAA
jgi:CP family cyanate transporter-like MFS transporter